MPLSVSAVTILGDQAENSIRQNCIDAQQSMQTLQRADAVTRINRGNSYATLQKLMTSMSARSAANTYNVPSLTQTTGEFVELKNTFVNRYTEYEIALRNLSSMDCETDPVLFYERLQSVRDQRRELADTISDMQKEINNFDKAVVELRAKIEERHGSSQ